MHVLIIESNAQLADGLRRTFQQRGHTSARTTAEAVLSKVETRYAVLVLEWTSDAPEMIARLRSTGRMVPVLALGDRADTEELVAALEQGADDFVAKADAPIDELIARTEALHRRAMMPPTARRIEANGIVVDEGMQTVFVHGEPRHVGTGELRMLGALAASMGKIISRDELFTICWREGVDVSPNALESVAKRVRRALGREGSRLRSVRLRGYVLLDKSIE